MIMITANAKVKSDYHKSLLSMGARFFSSGSRGTGAGSNWILNIRKSKEIH